MRMAGSPDGQGLPRQGETVPAGTAPVYPSAPGYPSTRPDLPGEARSPFAQTQTAAGSRPGASAQPGASAGWPADSARPREIVRHGPGVPVTVPGGPGEPTAEEVWRSGLPGGVPRRKRPLRRRFGPALTVVLFIAAIVVIYLRLHHAAFGVTGVAITKQVHNGCTTTLTGRISTTGGAGTVSYEWTFEPKLDASQPLSQSVAAGQSAVYVTAALAGQGHGSLTQTATLRTLGSRQASASAPVVISC
jgi:hypothetical protein